MREIERARIGEIVVSWWGRGSSTDERLPRVIAAARAHSIEVAAHLEPYAGRSIASVTDDIAYLRTLGISDVFVYHATDFPAAEWQPLTSSLSGVRLFAQTPLAGYAKKGGFQGIYTYDTLTYRARTFARMCTAAHKQGLLCAPSVGPGLQRAARDGRRADRRPRERAHVRLDVERGDPRGRRHDDDHELQRVERGNADRAGVCRTRAMRTTTARGASAATSPTAHTSTARATGSRASSRQRLGGPQLNERG